MVTRFILMPDFTGILIGVMFGCYLCFSIIGAINLTQGLSLHWMVSEESYFYKYSFLDQRNFKTEPVVALCIKGEYN